MFLHPHLRDGETEVQKDEGISHRNLSKLVAGQDLSRSVGIAVPSRRYPFIQGSLLCHPGGN